MGIFCAENIRLYRWSVIWDDEAILSLTNWDITPLPLWWSNTVRLFLNISVLQSGPLLKTCRTFHQDLVLGTGHSKKQEGSVICHSLSLQDVPLYPKMIKTSYLLSMCDQVITILFLWLKGAAVGTNQYKSNTYRRLVLGRPFLYCHEKPSTLWEGGNVRPRTLSSLVSMGWLKGKLQESKDFPTIYGIFLKFLP